VNTKKITIFSILIFFIALMLTVFVQNYTHSRKTHDHIKSILTREDENLKLSYYQILSSLVLAQERMVKRWIKSGRQTHADWLMDAISYVTDIKSYHAIYITDKDKQFIWSYPVDHFNPTFSSNQFDDHLKNRESWISPLTVTVDDAHFSVVSPIWIDDNLSGYVVGLLSLKSIFKQIQIDDFLIEVIENHKTAFSNHQLSINTPFISEEILFQNQRLQYKIFLEPALYKELMATPRSSYLIGLSISLIVALLVYIASISKFQSTLDRQKLLEKRALLYELHHRVKNNLQTIISLVEIYIQGETEKLQVEKYRTLQKKIISMALVHKLLYKTPSLEQVDVEEFIKLLIAEISKYSQDGENNVEVALLCEKIYFPMDKIIYLGLILNEVISNLFQNYPQCPKKLSIEHRDKFFKIVIKAIGLKTTNTVFWSNFKEGKTILDVIMRQLKGNYQFHENHDFIFEIELPV
jgi:two-component sensor histidine kinase